MKLREWNHVPECGLVQALPRITWEGSMSGLSNGLSYAFGFRQSSELETPHKTGGQAHYDTDSSKGTEDLCSTQFLFWNCSNMRCTVKYYYTIRQTLASLPLFTLLSDYTPPSPRVAPFDR